MSRTSATETTLADECAILREATALRALGREVETKVRAILLIELGTSLDSARDAIKEIHRRWGPTRVEREIDHLLAMLRRLPERQSNGHRQSRNGNPEDEFTQEEFAFRTGR